MVTVLGVDIGFSLPFLGVEIPARVVGPRALPPDGPTPSGSSIPPELGELLGIVEPGAQFVEFGAIDHKLAIQGSLAFGADRGVRGQLIPSVK